MAIAFDASASPAAGIGVTSITWTHTCTGSNLLLAVSIHLDTTSTDQVSAVRYNGVDLTRINTVTHGAFREYLYAMVAPSTGANSIVVSLSTSQTVVVGSASYTGVAQTGLPDAQATASGAGSTLSDSITTIADNCWLVGAYGNSGGTSTAGSGTFQRQQCGGSANRCIYDSNGPETPAGTYAINVNNGSSGNDYMLCGMSFAPVPITAFTKAMSDSVMNGASRSATVDRILAAIRVPSDSIMNAASRTAVLSKGFTRTVAASMMNAASRFATVARIFGVVRSPSDSIINGASRTTTLSRLMAYIRTPSDSITNGASRLATVARVKGWIRSMSDEIMAAEGRFATVRAFVNNIISIFKTKFTAQGTTYGDKFTKQDTEYEEKYQ